LYNIVCPCWVWPWYCLTFFDVFCITLFVLVGFDHGIVWRSSNQQGETMLYKTHRRMSDNTMAKTNRTNHVIQNTSGIVWRSSMCFV
jgi:hypothetical protein